MDEAAYRAAERALFTALGVEAEERWVDGVRVLSVGQGEPVLFVHGSPNTCATWAGLAARLGRRCLLLERPGAGLSPPRVWRDYRREVVVMLESVLDALGLDQIDVVGSSFGGLYAYYLAIDAPHRVRSLVQTSGPAGPPGLPMPSIFRLLSVLPLVPGARSFVPRPDAEGARGMYRDIGHGPAIARGDIADAWFPWYSALLGHTDTMVNLCHEVRAIASPLGYRRGRAPSEAEISGLAMPVLYLWGSADPFGTCEQGRALAALTPRAEFECFEGVGHLPWMDVPDAVAERMRAFWSPERAAG
jgi:pimeloyl-ACP methyl ester carboxylesterase